MNALEARGLIHITDLAKEYDCSRRYLEEHIGHFKSYLIKGRRMVDRGSADKWFFRDLRETRSPGRPRKGDIRR